MCSTNKEDRCGKEIPAIFALVYSPRHFVSAAQLPAWLVVIFFYIWRAACGSG